MDTLCIKGKPDTVLFIKASNVVNKILFIEKNIFLFFLFYSLPKV